METIQAIETIEGITCAENRSPEEIIENGLKLHDLVTEAVMNETDLTQSLTPGQIKKLQAFSFLFETTLDDAFMGGVLSGKYSGPDEHPLQPLYDSLAFHEGTAIQNCYGRPLRGPIIHIGSGYPETAIGIHRQFDVEVICVEKNTARAEKVEGVLQKFDLFGSGKILIVNALGQETLTGGEAVIISAMVPNEDKSKIIENMRRLAFGNSDEPLLVLRTPAHPSYSTLYPALFGPKDIRRWLLVQVGDTQADLKPREWLRSMVFQVPEMAEVRRGSDELAERTARRLRPVLKP